MVTRIFWDVWTRVTANNNQIPEEIQENDIVRHAVHIRVACSNLHQENEGLKATLVARPVFPDPMVVYTEKISERQSQVKKVQEVMSTAAKEAYDLLKGLQECSTSLTLNSQPVSLQLQQVLKEIQEATDPTGLDKLYAQADSLEV